MFPFSREVTRRVGGAFGREAVQKRGYVTKKEIAMLGGEKRALSLLERYGLEMRIQANRQCMYTGTRFLWQTVEHTSLIDRVLASWRGADYGRYKEVPREELVEALQRSPLRVVSENQAIPGSAYDTHHDFIATSVFTHEEEQFVLRVDKDDTIFYRSRSSAVEQSLLEFGYEAEDVSHFMTIIRRVQELAGPGEEFEKLTHQQLIDSEAWKLLYHVEPLDIFSRNLTPYEDIPLLRSPNPEMLAVSPLKNSGGPVPEL